MPYLGIAEQLLEEYREIAAMLAAVQPGSDEAEELRKDLDRLRDTYQRIVQTAQSEGKRVPPPFPLGAD